MQESSEKGIIQRVIDQVYAGFQLAQLEQTCLLRVSFLEIYNDSVTDLLEEETSPSSRQDSRGIPQINPINVSDEMKNRRH